MNNKKIKKKQKRKTNRQKPNTRQLSDIYNWYIGHKEDKQRHLQGLLYIT